MKQQKYLFFILVSLLYVSVNIYANGEQQHLYDWDKVDEKALNERQPPDKVMDSLGVKPGMSVGEVGAGGGRYAIKMAERVGPSGKVYANDIAQNAIDYMKKRCKKNNSNNIEVILGTETDPKFPPGKLDLVYLTFTYRHLSKPLQVLKNIKPALKKNGILAIIESKPSGSRSSEKEMINIAEQAGYRLVRTETFLTLDNIWVSSPKKRKRFQFMTNEKEKIVSKSVYQFKIKLKYINPEIWRRILVPELVSFWDLHVAIQDSMGWEDCHLHQFKIKKENQVISIGIPDEDPNDHESKLLAGWLTSIKKYFQTEGASLSYVYDFGDYWEHEIILEKILPANPDQEYPSCIAGKNACPPEDCGGPPGYEEILKVLKNPKNDQYKDTLDWIGEYFDPKDFNTEEVVFDDPKIRLKNMKQ